MVETIVALVERHTESVELRCEVADSHTEREPSTGKPVEGRRTLREDEWVPIAEHRQVGEHPDARVGGDRSRQRHERVKAAVPAAASQRCGGAG